KGNGAKVELMYSPMEIVKKAAENPDKTYVIAAVGFETTVPTYALTMEEAESQGIKNIKFITALKQVMPALQWICENENTIHGFICPGHVSVIIGSTIYQGLSQKYKIPCTVAGFEPEHILAAVYDLVCRVERKRSDKYEDFSVHNLYSNAVKAEGNEKAKDLMEKYFKPGAAMWRGLGIIENSGLYIRPEYESFDGGSYGLDQDMELPEAC
ncbi:MAG: hydrogenase formation protein HypD, partial [Anaerovorax sp.]